MCRKFSLAGHLNDHARGSRANAAAIASYNAEHDTTMAIRQVRDLNDVVEQDHRAVKRIVRPMLGFKSMETA
jgi:putative transposase